MSIQLGDRARSIPFGVTGTVVRFDDRFGVFVLKLDQPMPRIGHASLTELTATPASLQVLPQ